MNLTLIQQVALAIAPIASYWLVTLVTRLLVLTFATYFVMSPTSRLEDIGDIYASNEIVVAALACIAFLILSVALFPHRRVELALPKWRDRVQRARLMQGLRRGMIYGAVVVLTFWMGGYYRPVGFYIRIEEAIGSIAAVVLRVFTLAMLVIGEEAIFRKMALSRLRPLAPAWICAFALSIPYVWLKWVQFDLGVMQMTTLMLVSFALTLKAHQEPDPWSGAGLWLGMLLLFHPLLGLPIFGTDVPGLFLMSYRGADPASGAWFGAEADARTALFVSGGLGGPLSGFTFQFVILLWVVRWMIRNKEIQTWWGHR